jgi:hypothetical protein
MYRALLQPGFSSYAKGEILGIFERLWRSITWAVSMCQDTLLNQKPNVSGGTL